MNDDQLRVHLDRQADLAPVPTPDLAERVLQRRSASRRRRAGLLGTAIAIVVLLTGVPLTMAALRPTPTVGASPSSPPPRAQQNPLGLFGFWSVDAPDVDDGVLLRLDSRLVVLLGCGPVEGQWQANVGGDFLAGVSSWSGSCSTTTAGLPWLAEAAGFEFDGADAVLLDATGTPTARLHLSAPPGPSPDMWPGYTEPPVVTDADRQRFTGNPALPAGLRPATTDTMIGRWIPVDNPDSTPFVTFSDDRSWTGSDGCNGIAGRWQIGTGGAQIGTGGALLGTTGAQTLIGCDYRPIGAWLSTTALAGFDGDTLVLVGPDGNEIGRLKAG